jgi:hypothetical protein
MAPRNPDPTLKLCFALVLGYVVLMPGAAEGAGPATADATSAHLPSVASGAWMPTYVNGHGARIVNPYGGTSTDPADTLDDVLATARVFMWNLDTAIPPPIHRSTRRRAGA